MACTEVAFLSESGSYKVPTDLNRVELLQHINMLPTLQIPDGLGKLFHGESIQIIQALAYVKWHGVKMDTFYYQVSTTTLPF